MLLEELALPESALCFTEIRHPFITSGHRKPGDIDFLACDSARPDQVAVIEWKRIKIKTRDQCSDRTNRLEGLGRVGPQVRALHGLGFARTYLGVIAVVDGRERQQDNFLFRGASDETWGRVVEVVWGLSLPEEIGVVYVEIVQPVDKSIGEAFMMCIGVLKPAIPQEQGMWISTTVENYINRPRA